MKTIVIGSGMSGLTAALYCAREGNQVTVFEQGGDIGGVTATMERDGFRWDIGPLNLEGFAPGEPAGRILSDLGVYGSIRLVREDRGASYPDFTITRPAEYKGPYWRRDELKKLFPDEAPGIDRYYRLFGRVSSLMRLAREAEWSYGIVKILRTARMYAALIPLLPKLKWSAARLTDRLFKSEKLKAVFTSMLADFVVRPSEFIGLGLPAINPETAYDRRIPFADGASGMSYHCVVDGCRTMVDAMAARLKELGGSIRISSPVTDIVVESGRVTGVKCGDEFIPADLIIASGGARETFFGLVGKEHLTAEYIERVETLPLMESVLMVQLGIDFDPAKYQDSALRYYIGTYAIEEAVDELRSGHYHRGRDGFLIYVPSWNSPGMAPSGMHAVTVYTVAPDRLDEGTWDERREELADELLAAAEKVMPGLREHAKVRVVLTPDDFRRITHLSRHAFGGFAPVMGREGVPHRTPVRGLYFIGAQSASGGGIGNVVQGARRAYAMIARDMR